MNRVKIDSGDKKKKTDSRTISFSKSEENKIISAAKEAIHGKNVTPPMSVRKAIRYLEEL